MSQPLVTPPPAPAPAAPQPSVEQQGGGSSSVDAVPSVEERAVTWEGARGGGGLGPLDEAIQTGKQRNNELFACSTSTRSPLRSPRPPRSRSRS